MTERKKMNTSIAGYHILMILSAVDCRFNIEEDLVVKDWLHKEFPINVNLDNEMEILSALHPLDWKSHFKQCMSDYYAEATEQERKDLLKFSLELVHADNVFTAEENEYITLLFDEWDTLNELH